MRHIRLLLLLSCQTAGALCAAAGESGRLPTMALLAPTGASPATMPPWAIPALEAPALTLPDGAPRVATAPSAPGMTLPRIAQKPTTGKASGDDDDEETPRFTRPGRLPTNFVKLPELTPQLKPRASFGPHLKPDAEFDLGNNASFGIIGLVDTRQIAGISGSGAKPPTSLLSRPRDIGLGASFEIKFGQ